MKILKYWETNYHQKKLDWAYSAHNEFLEKLKSDKSLTEFKINTNEVRIALFGSSGVGKTTLLLKLLGIKDEYFDKIAQILRCGQPQGEASTPTAFIYKLNENNHFSFCNEENLSEMTIEEKLINIRKDVEDQKYVEVNKPISIGLPIKYFKITNEKFLNLKIIDLPGHGSSNLKEQPHVKQIIFNYTDICDLILLVDKAEHISSFSDIKFNSLQNWKESSHKFRIITTYSVSPNSIRSNLKNTDNLDKSKYLKLFREAFVDTHFKTSLPNDFIIYPLEYGYSWGKKEIIEFFSLKLKSTIDSILNELFEDLRNDIVKSTNKYSRLLISKQHQNCIVRIKDKVESEIKSELEKLKMKIDELNSRIEDYQDCICNYNLKIDDEKRKEKSFCGFKTKKFLNDFYQNNELILKGIKAQTFINYINCFRETLTNEFNKRKGALQEHINNEFQSKILNEFNLPTILDKELSKIKEKIVNYKWGYWWHNENGELEKIEICFSNCLLHIENTFNSPLKKEISEYNNVIEENILKIEKEILVDKDNLNKYVIKKNEVELQKINKEKKWEEEKLEFDHDISICNDFNNILKNNFILKYNKIINKRYNIKNGESVLSISYLALITKEFKNLLSI